MTPELWVAILSSPIAAVVGSLAGSYIRESSREAAKKQIGETLRGELSIFKESLLKGINGTYQRSDRCKLIEKGISENVGRIDQELDDLSGYVHETKHDLTSRVFGLETRATAEERGG